MLRFGGFCTTQRECDVNGCDIYLTTNNNTKKKKKSNFEILDCHVRWILSHFDTLVMDLT